MSIYSRPDFSKRLQEWSAMESARIEENHRYDMRIINICAGISLVLIAIFAFVGVLTGSSSVVFLMLISIIPAVFGPSIFEKKFERTTFEDYVCEYDKRQQELTIAAFDDLVQDAKVETGSHTQNEKKEYA